MFLGITPGFVLGLPSLLSRFQGSLLGRSWFLARGSTVSTPGSTQPDRDRPNLYGVVEQAILKSRGDLQEIIGEIAPKIAPIAKATIPHDFLDDLLLALVPLILYGHETPKRLRSQLTAIHLVGADAGERVLLGWTELLIELLSSRATVNLEQMGTWAEAIGHPEIQDGLKRGQSLTEMPFQVSAGPCPALAIALYCFSTTPDAPALTWARAKQYSHTAPALALTLSGAYLGWAGLPQHLSHPDDPSVLTGLHLAQQLWQHWLGVYLPPAHASPRVSFGAAQTLQPRSGRSLISLIDP